AEDGIRDDLVTGVQTCALPISSAATRTRRDRSRTDSPFPSLHSIYRGVGPGCAEQSAAAARRLSGSGAAGDRQRRLSPTAPDVLRPLSARAPSTMNGAWSSPRSRSLYPPVRSSGASATML